MSTTSTEFSSFIPPEAIAAGLASANLAPHTALQLAHVVPVGPGQGGVVSVPWPDAVSVPAGTKAENAEDQLVTLETSDVTITAGTVQFTFRVSAEADFDAVVSAVQTAVAQGVVYAANRIDADGLSIITSASNTTSNTGNDLTESRFLTAMYAFEAQNPARGPDGIAYIAAPVPYRDWAIDLNANGGGHIAGDAESERVAAQQAGGSGFKGVRHGVRLYQSTNCPTTGDDCNAAFVVAGQGGPLMYAVWRPLTPHVELVPRRNAFEATISVRYGWSKGRDADMREHIVDNRA